MAESKKCSRCNGAGQADVLKKVLIWPDNKTCSYIQDREQCNLCEGKGVVPEEAPVKIKGRG